MNLMNDVDGKLKAEMAACAEQQASHSKLAHGSSSLDQRVAHGMATLSAETDSRNKETQSSLGPTRMT